MLNAKEEWRPILGYNSLYLISDHGRVRNRKTGHLLSTPLSRNGYRAVSLWRYGHHDTFLVHRLIAIAFIGESKPKFEINHIDGNKLNNSISNLEWVSRSDNIRHAYRIGLRTANPRRGQDHHWAKLTKEQVLEIKATPSTVVARLLACRYGVSKNTIKMIRSGKTWKSVH